MTDERLEGFFLDKDGVRHRTFGYSNHAEWHLPNAPTMNWDAMSECRLAKTSEGSALSTAVRPVTCVLCVANER